MTKLETCKHCARLQCSRQGLITSKAQSKPLQLRHKEAKLCDHVYCKDGTVFTTKISAIPKWMALKHTQYPSESHCPAMKQEIGERGGLPWFKGRNSFHYAHWKNEGGGGGALSFRSERTLLEVERTVGDKIDYILSVQMVQYGKHDIYRIVVKS